MTIDSRRLRRIQTAKTLAAIGMSGGLTWLAATTWVLRRQAVIQQGGRAMPMPGLVLGCRPGPALHRRVRGAIELYRAGALTRVIISGYGEAAYARSFAIENGLPDACIQLETQARTTLENLTFSQPVLLSNPFWLITHRWHMPRALWMCQDLSMDAHPYLLNSPETPGNQARALAREGVSVIHRWMERPLL